MRPKPLKPISDERQVLDFLKLVIALTAVIYFIARMGWCPPDVDPLDSFLKYCYQNSVRWNPKIPRSEIKQYGVGVWVGCGEDPKKARTYFHICVEETGMRCLDNPAGFGYSGATWKLIKKVLKVNKVDLKGLGYWTWAEQNPMILNCLLANYFCSKEILSSPLRWHNSRVADNNRRYVLDIAKIKKRCEGG